MLHKCCLFVLACVFAATASGAQTAEELIEKNLAAKGGEARLMACNSIRITGEGTGSSGKASVLVEVKQPEKIFMKVTVGEKSNVQVVDGASGWEVLGISGKTEPQKLNEQQLKYLKFRTNYRGELVGYKQRGVQAEYRGLVDLEGAQAHLIKLTKSNGDVVQIYLDPTTFLEIKQEHVVHVGEYTVELEDMFKDYKEVSGLVFAHTMGFRIKGGEPQWIPAQYEVNPELPDSRFVMPEPAKEAAGMKNR